MRGAGLVAPVLRAEIEARRISAKELAMLMRAWAAQDPVHRWAPDYRTIQAASLGRACSLDTYLAFAGFFGWDFSEAVQTPVHGADPLTAREAELARQLAEAAASQSRIERERAARAARPPRLAVVAREYGFPGAPAPRGGRAQAAPAPAPD
jgi:hypothetical protein